MGDRGACRRVAPALVVAWTGLGLGVELGG